MLRAMGEIIVLLIIVIIVILIRVIIVILIRIIMMIVLLIMIQLVILVLERQGVCLRNQAPDATSAPKSRRARQTLTSGSLLLTIFTNSSVILLQLVNDNNTINYTNFTNSKSRRHGGQWDPGPPRAAWSRSTRDSA